jgi:nitrate reductase assembly molybdenum cofactor insertion protein NarJ
MSTLPANAPEIDALEADALAFALGAALMGYPDADFVPRLRSLLATPALQPLLAETNARAVLAPVLTVVDSPDAIDDLRSEYIECFDRAALSPLYEGEYGRQRMVGKTPVLADLAGFYQAFGFEVVDSASAPGAETADHLAVELEFVGVLLLKEAALVRLGDSEGVEIVRDARRKFLSDHLGGFARGIVRRSEVARSRFYTAAMGFVSGRVEAQCATFMLDPPALEGGGSAAESDEMKCGDCALTSLTQAQ